MAARGCAHLPAQRLVVQQQSRGMRQAGLADQQPGLGRDAAVDRVALGDDGQAAGHRLHRGARQAVAGGGVHHHAVDRAATPKTSASWSTWPRKLACWRRCRRAARRAPRHDAGTAADQQAMRRLRRTAAARAWFFRFSAKVPTLTMSNSASAGSGTPSPASDQSMYFGSTIARPGRSWSGKWRSSCSGIRRAPARRRSSIGSGDAAADDEAVARARRQRRLRCRPHAIAEPLVEHDVRLPSRDLRAQHGRDLAMRDRLRVVGRAVGDGHASSSCSSRHRRLAMHAPDADFHAGLAQRAAEDDLAHAAAHGAAGMAHQQGEAHRAALFRGAGGGGGRAGGVEGGEEGVAPLTSRRLAPRRARAAGSAASPWRAPGPRESRA